MDEMSLYLQATSRRVWYPVGQRPIVRISPQRDCQHWYGALALNSGQEVALSVPTLDSQTTIHFLTHLPHPTDFTLPGPCALASWSGYSRFYR
jgi:hypothetical protein